MMKQVTLNPAQIEKVREAIRRRLRLKALRGLKDGLMDDINCCEACAVRILKGQSFTAYTMGKLQRAYNL